MSEHTCLQLLQVDILILTLYVYGLVDCGFVDNILHDDGLQVHCLGVETTAFLLIKH